jgi:NADPH:quinone reductase-like Zn-dependent oxidoreductase
VRAVVITRHGGPEVLAVEERPRPACAPGRVRIAVAAAGVNFSDLLARAGMYPDAPPLPAVMGYEVAGTVAEVGAGVDDLMPGDRVMAATRFGGQAEEAVAGRGDVIRLPDGLSFAQGAAIPVNYATAWAALFQYGGLRPGERVLIHAAAGGVGTAAVQLAHHATAEVWGTASPAKHGAVRAQGADRAVDYTARGWDRGLPRFDVVLDAIGGASLQRSYRLLRPGGRLVAYGATSVLHGGRRDLRRAAGPALRMLRGFSVLRQIGDSRSVIGLNMLRLGDDRGTLEPWIAPLQELLERGAIRPVVAAEVPFACAADAHRLLGERRNVGKVVLVP